MNIFSRKYAVLFIVLIAVILRLYRIDYPLLDWHSFRQVDTASVTREFQRNGIDLLRPTYHDLGNIQSGLDNPEGYRMVEFPIINAVTAILATAIPFLSLEIMSRLVSIAFSIGSILTLYYFVQRYSGTKTALFTAFFYAVMAYPVYYSRAVLPEAGMLFFSLLSLFAFSNWLTSQQWKWYALAAVSLMLALLIKPFVLFIAPVYAALLVVHKHYTKLSHWLQAAIFAAVSVIPLFLWRSWIQHFPTGIPANDWLYNGPLHGVPPRFRPVWFRVLFYDRIIVALSGFTGALFLLANLLKRTPKEVLIYGAWWVGCITYFAVIARGNIQHDYYQNLLIPITMISLGRGLVIADTVLTKKCNSIVALATVMIITLSMIGASWYKLHGYFNVNNWEYFRAGQRVAELVPEDAKVIAPAFGDTSFLFYTERSGWPIGFDIQQKIEAGATHYVTTSYDDEARELEKSYFIIEKTPEYLILDLTRRPEKE